MSKRCKSIVYVIVGCFVLAVLLLLIKLLCFSGLFLPMMKLNGDALMEVNVNEKFMDPGVKTRYHLASFNDDIRVKHSINDKKTGVYKVVYYSPKHDIQRTRSVHVVDHIAPQIKVNGSKMQRVFVNREYQEQGATSVDNYDGDLTKKIVIKQQVNTKKIGTYQVIYTIRDESGNESSVARKVEVCEDPTRVKLHYNHDSYDNTMEEWWFHKAKDHKRTTGAKDEAFLLKYNTYLQGPDQKVIYLTFDEGGNDITYIKEIADVLKEHDVVATYFLTRNYIKSNPEFMNQLIKDGNVIGNHTWHHYDMTTLANASSVDSFVKEISETEKTYMEVTGKKMKKIFRFPKGGSSERAMKMVADLGYSTYNWSHAYYDYASDVSGEDALKTMLDHYHNGAIYLLHPSNKGNYEAIGTFVEQMKDKGYTFKTVDSIPKEVREKH